MKLLLLPGLVLAALALAPSAMTESAARPPVIKYQDDVFGPILTTRTKQPLYFWTVEKRAGGKIRCKGTCARLWPPVIVPRRSAVPRRIAGIPGRFGVIRRPSGKLQVTHRGLPVYSYAHEEPEQVLCDDVDGWFVVRLR
jgi:predicted lipoprotein with Yx(FWY)xxD motif